MRAGRFMDMYNESNPALLAKMASLQFLFFREMYKALEADKTKRIYVPTQTYLVDAQEFAHKQIGTDGKYEGFDLPTQTGVLVVAKFACCYAYVGSYLYVSMQGHDDKAFGVAGFIGMDLANDMVNMPPHVADDEELKTYMVGMLNVVLYMGMKPKEIVQTVPSGTRYKSALEGQEAVNIRNMSPLPVTVLDRNYKRTYVVEEKEIGGYTRKQWYGSKAKGTRRLGTKAVAGYTRPKHERTTNTKTP